MRIRYRTFLLISILLAAGSTMFFSLEAKAITSSGDNAGKRWRRIFVKYQNDKNVDRLIFVKYKGGSKAGFYMYKKTNNSWKRIIKCFAYVGKNGINKKRAGDYRTPTGTYQITMGFGIKKNPGTKITYKKLNKYLYWSARKKDYNQLVDIRKSPGVYGEHLIHYKPQYNYALAMDFNKKGIYPKGSAIFLHCTGKNKYTAGCIAIKEKYMKKVLKNVTKHTKICIYNK